MTPVFGVRLAAKSGTTISIGSSSFPLLFVRRMAIAAPLESVTVIATSSNGISAVLVYAWTCMYPTADRIIPPFKASNYNMQRSMKGYESKPYAPNAF